MQLSDHLQSCPKQKRPCRYSQFGCPFEVGTSTHYYNTHSSGIMFSPPRVIPKGDIEELSCHDKEATSQHLELVSHTVRNKRDLESSERVPAITAPDMQEQKQATDRQIIAIHGELSRLAEEVGIQITPLREEIVKLESSLADLQEGFSELASWFRHSRLPVTMGSSSGRSQR